MSDGLIKRLRDIGEEETGYGIRNEAADLIEQQAAEIVNLKHDIERHIANHAADLNAVAPAVDAQPVAWRHKATKILRNDSIAKGADFEPDDWEPLYATPQSEGLRKDAERYPHAAIGAALISTGLYDRMNDITGDDREARYLIEELISKVDPILDEWHNAALSQHTGEKDD